LRRRTAEKGIAMKRIISLILAFVTVVALFSCKSTDADVSKLKIVTTIFPQYDIASHISGGKADVTMLLPFGSDIHTYEPSVKDMTDVASCDIFIYNGVETEPWTVSILESIDRDNTVVVDLSENITLLEGDVHESHDHSEDEHIHDYDPHFWTSPRNAVVITDEILSALCTVDETNADHYIMNAQNLKVQLSSLDSELSDMAENYDGTPLYFGGKFAFLYMFSEYGFEHRSPYNGCSDQAEPSIKTIADICEDIEKDRVKYIFTEEMSQSKIAKSIADETGTELLVLHSCHNLSKDEAKAGETYVSLMYKNIANMRKALNERK